jgi:hypothetical protein
MVSGGDLDTYLERVDSFAKPQRRVEDWGTQPMVPGAALAPRTWIPFCSGCREGDTFWPQVYLTNDDPAFTAGIIGLTYPVNAEPDFWRGLHLYRDGAEIPLTPFMGFYPSYRLPPDTGRYRLVMDADAGRNNTLTVWDFTSRGTANGNTAGGGDKCVLQGLEAGPSPGCRAEPLIFLRYSGLDLSLRNVAEAPGAKRFEVTTYRQRSTVASPAIAGLKLWVSYDGGGKWTQALVQPKGNGRFAVTVVHPPAKHRASDTVMLRAEAWYAEGNRVEQTVRNAYYLG